MKEIVDYPKLYCPFVKDENFRLTPQLAEGFEWLYDKGVLAVDKLHGTNLCVNIQGGHIETIDNRTTRMCKSCFIPIKGNANKFLIGVLNACNRGWLEENGRYYGELIGPDINGNIHGTSEYLFVPFDYLHKKNHWHSWVQNKYPKDFNSISDWFKELPSLFSKRVFGKDVLAEGLVFYHPDGRKCKLRRDMFDWYQGENIKERVMTGKEAQRLLNQVTQILYDLLDGKEREAFFKFGVMTEQLEMFVKIDLSSLNPTATKEEE